MVERYKDCHDGGGGWCQERGVGLLMVCTVRSQEGQVSNGLLIRSPGQENAQDKLSFHEFWKDVKTKSQEVKENKWKILK